MLIKNLLSVAIGILLWSNTPLFSAIGCMTYPHSIDYSEHELYRPVTCSCPCRYKVSPEQGQCADCHHFGDPNRGFKLVNQDLR